MKIVFERLSKSTTALAAWYLTRKHEVFCLSTGTGGKTRRLLTSGLMGRTVTLLDLLPSTGNHLYEAHRLAFEHVEELFEKRCRSHSAVRILDSLFGTPIVEAALKKKLLHELFKFYSINYIGSVLEKHFGAEEFLFVPSRGERPERFDGVDRYLRTLAILKEARIFHFDNPRMRFSWWLLLWNSLMVPGERLLWVGKALALLGLMIGRYLLGPRAKRPVKEHKYGIMVTAPARQFANDIQGIDFLVDGQMIRKEEILVIAHGRLREEYRRRLKDKGLRYVEIRLGDWERAPIAEAIPALLRVLGAGWSAPHAAREAALSMALYYVKWQSVAARHRVKHLVTYSDMALQTIARNLILKRHGTTLWYYMDSVNFPCYLAPREEEFDRYLHYRAGFLHYDYFISWCDQVSTYFKMHRQAIGRYVTVGCLWAEHTRQLEEGTIPNGLEPVVRQRLRSRPSGKVVGVFDSSFMEGSPTPYADGVAFLQGVERLLAEGEDIFVLLKEKKPRHSPSHPPEFVELCDRLDRHPRCLATSPGQNASEVIALSDLTIAFPFTSVGFEALSVGRKAVFFDPFGKLDESYYDRAPGLVCRGYEELHERVRELLRDVTDEEYESYLDRYVRGKIVPDRDGRALTRFREMLVGASLAEPRSGNHAR